MAEAYHDRAMAIAEAMRRDVLEKYARIEPEPPSEIHLTAKVVLN